MVDAKATEQALQIERQNSTRLQEQVQTLDQSIHDYSEQVQQQQQTISLLVSEKTSLSAAVERLESTEQGMGLVFQCGECPLTVPLQRYKRPRSGWRLSSPEAPNCKSGSRNLKRNLRRLHRE